MAVQPGPRGPVYPQNYPVPVGEKYQYYGEQPGYIYNPYTDKYEPDPKQAKAWGEQTGLIEPEPTPPGLAEQLLPIAAGAGALYGGKYIAEKGLPGLFGGGTPSSVASTTTGGPVVGMVDPASVSTSVSGGASSATSTAPGLMGGSEVGTFDATGPIGSTIGTTAQGVLGAAGLALGSKGVYDAYEAGDPLSGAISGAGAGAGGLALAGALGASTGGLAIPVILGASLLGGGAGFLGGKKGDNDYRRERWGGAINQGATEADKQSAQQLYDLNQKAADSDGVFDSGILAGRKWKWEDVKNLGTGQDVWGSVGFFEAFPDWISGHDEQQRADIAQAALDWNLLTNDNGSLIFSGKRGDLDKIRQIGADIKAGTYVPPKTPEQREAERQAYADKIGVQYRPSVTLEDGTPPGQPVNTGVNMDYQNRGGANGPLLKAGEKPGMMGATTTYGPAIQPMLGAAKNFSSDPNASSAIAAMRDELQAKRNLMEQPQARTSTLSPGIGLDGRPISY